MARAAAPRRAGSYERSTPIVIEATEPEEVFRSLSVERLPPFR